MEYAIEIPTMTFAEILNRSISASWLVLAVIGLRFVLKKAPRAFHCALWVLVAVRLLCPVLPESPMSLVPAAQIVPEEYLYMQPRDDLGQRATLDLVTNPIYPQALEIELDTRVGTLQVRDVLWTLTWWTGMGVMAIYALFSYLSLRLRIRVGVRLRGNIWLCDDIDSPFILGMIRPRICLPSDMMPELMEPVIAHEQAHLKRGDHWWKPLGFVLLTVHWFNPVMWLAYFLLCRDIELACDERVIRDMDKASVRRYSEALVACSAPRRWIAACPLAFGEVGVKERVKTMLSYKKPGFWILLIGLVLSVAAAVCFLTNPAAATMGNIEELAFDAIFENPEGVKLSNGFYTYDDKDHGEEIVSRLSDIELDPTPVSRSRDEDREWAYVVRGFNSGGLLLCFSADFSEVWAQDGVKPSYTYALKDPEELKSLLAEYFPGVGMNVLPFVGTYVPYDCLYMNSLSSYYPFAGDSGEVYHFMTNYFATESRAGFVRIYDPVNWDWQPVDWESEPFCELSGADPFSGDAGLQGWIGTNGLYQPLDEDRFLLYDNGQLVIVATVKSPGHGRYLWSVYRLIPENEMGMAEWEFNLLHKTEYPAFRFEFDMEYTSISATVAGGRLCSYDEPSIDGFPSGQTLEFPAGTALYWCPVDEHGNIVQTGSVHFAVINGEQTVAEGILYITGTKGRYEVTRNGDDTVRKEEPALYTAKLIGTGLYLSQNEDELGGVVEFK